MNKNDESTVAARQNKFDTIKLDCWYKYHNMIMKILSIKTSVARTAIEYEDAFGDKREKICNYTVNIDDFKLVNSRPIPKIPSLKEGMLIKLNKQTKTIQKINEIQDGRIWLESGRTYHISEALVLNWIEASEEEKKCEEEKIQTLNKKVEEHPLVGTKIVRDHRSFMTILKIEVSKKNNYFDVTCVTDDGNIEVHMLKNITIPIIQL